MLISTKAYEQTQIRAGNDTLYGYYYSTKGGDKFIIDSCSFRLRRQKNRMMDASVPNCDTIAKGKWQLFKKGVLRLSDDTNCNKVNYDINSIKKFSNDTVYIKIVLPKDAAFFKGRFKYELLFVGNINSLESASSLIAIAKDKVFFKGSTDYHIGLIVQDLYPLNCDLMNSKCYQRFFSTSLMILSLIVVPTTLRLH